jgi:hypothetical protein
MEGGGEDSDGVEAVDEPGVLADVLVDGFDGVIGLEVEFERFGEHAFEAQDMDEHEGDDEDGAEALEEIKEVMGEGVVNGVGLAGECDPGSVDGVEEDGEEDEGPFDGEEEREGMDFFDLLNEHGIGVETGAVDESGVDEEVDEEVAAEEDAGEGMESAEEEIGHGRDCGRG